MIGVIYGHPLSSILQFQNDLLQVLKSLARNKKDYIRVGDFNIDIHKVEHGSQSIHTLTKSMQRDVLA